MVLRAAAIVLLFVVFIGNPSVFNCTWIAPQFSNFFQSVLYIPFVPKLHQALLVIFPFIDNHKEIITPKLSNFIQDVLSTADIPGVSIGIVGPGGHTEFGAWGIKTDEGENLTPDTLFHLASCSKAFLSSAVGILIDDFANGRNTTPLPSNVQVLDWHTKVKDILPKHWELMDEWATEKANIRDILSHVSGLPSHDFSYGPEDTTEDIAHRMKHLRPAFEFREQFSYNNQMFMIATLIFSEYTSGSYTSFVRERIFLPLNMTSTFFSVEKANPSGQLTESWSENGRSIPRFWHPESDIHTGPGGIISNVIDVAKWIRMLLNSGVDPLTNRTILPGTTFNETITAYAIVHGDPRSPIDGYAMGWSILSHGGHNVIMHTGTLPGFSTSVSLLPHNNWGHVILMNAHGNGKGQANKVISEQIFQTIMGKDRTDAHSAVKSLQEPVSPKPPARTIDPSYELHVYSGEYSNSGYGSLTLCNPGSTSDYCTQVLADFIAVDNATNRSEIVGVPQLYAAWPRIFASHVRLVHLFNNTFLVEVPKLFPDGYGRNREPFATEIGKGGVAEFVVKNGKVVGVGFEGESTNGQRNGSSVQERADIWFDKTA